MTRPWIVIALVILLAAAGVGSKPQVACKPVPQISEVFK